jgi:hypothetical protein
MNSAPIYPISTRNLGFCGVRSMPICWRRGPLQSRQGCWADTSMDVTAPPLACKAPSGPTESEDKSQQWEPDPLRLHAGGVTP